ncbi:hypothetical protein BJY52DRAFT_1223027 [Lactarius psammicola]|nr:hypothetical protein BJY52DRAFT_1223027 [Lactarius psammicola]
MAPTRHERTRTKAVTDRLTKHTTATTDKVCPGTQTNQHLPCPPNDTLRPILKLYFYLGMSDKDIATSVMDHFDPARYGISVYTVRRRRKDWGLESTRRQKHTTSRSAFLIEVPKRLGKPYCWKIRFGYQELLFLSISDRPSQMLLTHGARSIGGIPLITQSDPGTETIDGSSKHGNIKPEIHWSVFRRDWAVGFQALLDEWVDSGYYDIRDPLECLVFRFVFIPFIQREVDAWVHQHNWTKRRSDQKKVLPNGIPMIILQKPHKWKAADYKISVPPETLNEIEKKYAPPDDPVFELVPHVFAVHANTVWTAMGSPQPQFHNAWEIYLHIRDALRGIAQDGMLQQVLSSVSATPEPQHCLDEIPADLKPTDKDDLLIVEDSDDEGSTLVIDLTEDKDYDEDNNSEGHSIGLDFF